MTPAEKHIPDSFEHNSGICHRERSGIHCIGSCACDSTCKQSTFAGAARPAVVAVPVTEDTLKRMDYVEGAGRHKDNRSAEEDMQPLAALEDVGSHTRNVEAGAEDNARFHTEVAVYQRTDQVLDNGDRTGLLEEEDRIPHEEAPVVDSR